MTETHIRRATATDRPAIDAFATVVITDTYSPLVGSEYAAGLLNS